MSENENNSSVEKTDQADQPVKVNWSTRHKDKIDIVFKFGALAAALFTLYYLNLQINSSEKQARAVWQSFRPALDIKAISPVKDLLPAEGKVRTLDSNYVDSRGFWTLNYTLHNYGHSPAKLILSNYERISNSNVTIKTEWLSGVSIIQGIGTNMKFPLALTKSSHQAFLKISIDYGWEVDTDPPIIWSCTKLYQVWSENDVWRVKVTTDSVYNSYRDTIPDERRYKF